MHAYTFFLRLIKLLSGGGSLSEGVLVYGDVKQNCLMPLAAT